MKKQWYLILILLVTLVIQFGCVDRTSYKDDLIKDGDLVCSGNFVSLNNTAITLGNTTYFFQTSPVWIYLVDNNGIQKNLVLSNFQTYYLYKVHPNTSFTWFALTEVPKEQLQ
jgi:hypothetical protein